MTRSGTATQSRGGTVRWSPVGTSDPRPPRTRRSSPVALTGIVATLTAIVALSSAIVALTFDLSPGLRPDPRTQFQGSLRVIAVEPGVSYGAWLRRTSRSQEDYAARREAYIRQGGSAAGLSLPGHVVYVATDVSGFKWRSVRLLWSLYDARTKARVPELADQDVATVRADAPTDQTLQLVWVPELAQPGSVFIRAELYDDRGILLAVADSPQFSKSGGG